MPCINDLRNRNALYFSLIINSTDFIPVLVLLEVERRCLLTSKRTYDITLDHEMTIAVLFH